MKKLKKSQSFILSLLIVLSMFAGLNFSTIAATADVLSYEIIDGSAVVTYCEKEASGELVIPDTLGGCLVTTIGDFAFEGCGALTTVTIPNSVTRIGIGAFSCCMSLTTMTIPDSVTEIGATAFECCGFNAVTLPAHLTGIEYGVFSGCDNLTSITIPEGVSIIGQNAFYDCFGLKSVTIPDSVTEIGGCAFFDCSSLESVVLPEELTSIEPSTFCSCTSLTSITIPDSVTNIDILAFFDTGFYNDASNWEDDVLYIGNHLIQAKNTINGNYTIKDGTKCIADEAFKNCSGLTGITVPGSVTGIGEHALGYAFDDFNWEYETIDGFVIYGAPGTVAESYASDNGITFVAVAEEPTTKAPETTTEPTADEPTTAALVTTDPTTQSSSELIVKDADSGITVMEDELIASIDAVDNKGLTAEAIKAKLGNEGISIVNEDGEELADDALVGTGCTVRVLDKDGNVLSEYTVLVPMDVDGDALITAQDARAALRAAAQLEALEGVYRKAANADGDESLTASDARTILRKAANLE